MTTNTEICDDEHQFVIASLKENKVFCTEGQFIDAHKAQILYHGTSHPILSNFKCIAQVSWIKTIRVAPKTSLEP